jgi:hypothetical protein
MGQGAESGALIACGGVDAGIVFIGIGVIQTVEERVGSR